MTALTHPASLPQPELPRFLLDAGVKSVVVEKELRVIWGKAFATYEPETGIIRLRSGLSPMARLVVLLHEYFHALYGKAEQDVRSDERKLLNLLDINLHKDEALDFDAYTPDGKLDLYVSEEQEKWDRWCQWATQ